jgi:sigma-B regulation protein RsbU (phosphoserine phosphatase)
MSGHGIPCSGAETKTAGADERSRILIVDDLQSSRTLIGSVLSAAGFLRLDYAADGIEAIDRLYADPPDMVILDIVMPRMDGFEVCRKVREELRLDIPILIQTGVQEAEYRVMAFDAGASDIVSKPVNAGELVSRVRLHLERRRLMDSLQRYRRRMEEELLAAQAMQQSLLMADDDVGAIVIPRGATMQTYHKTSNVLGGDLWQVFPVDEHRFGIFMIDLSGHGVSAAINAFRVHMLAGGMMTLRADPAGWLEALNLSLFQILPVEHFATAFYGVVEPRQGRLDYAAAGSPSPILLRDGGGWEALDGGGLILGCSQSARYPVRRAEIGSGDRLFVYSDALYENFDDPDRTFDTAELAERVELAATDGALPFSDALLNALFGTSDCQLRDDLTWMLVEVNAP